MLSRVAPSPGGSGRGMIPVSHRTGTGDRHVFMEHPHAWYRPELSTRARVVIAGHSYIKRLERFCTNLHCRHHLRLQNSCHVRWICEGGAEVSYLREHFCTIVNSFPDCVVIQIGGNDLSGESALAVYRKIRNFVSDLREVLPARAEIVVCSLMYRDRARSRGRRRVPIDYNQNVDVVNDMLEALFEHVSRVRLWRHDLETLYRHLDAHGVHLDESTPRNTDGSPVATPSGQDLYWSSIRGAVLSGLRGFRCRHSDSFNNGILHGSF